MNHKYILLSVIVAMFFGTFAQQSIAQIPNAGFENWVSGDPVDWTTTNAPPTIVNITQTAQSHSGALAAHGEVANFAGFAYAPNLISGPEAQGFPVSERHLAVHGWYKFNPAAPGDVMLVTVAMLRPDTVIGGGTFATTVAQSTYAEFVANIFYSFPSTPDTCYIAITIFGSGGLPTIGSSFDVDDLSFGAPTTDVAEEKNFLPGTFALSQNYPNPFNPSTQIRYTIPADGLTSLIVYDMLGREVAVLENSMKHAGTHTASFDASNLSSGVYMYKLQSGSHTETRSMVVMK